MLIDEVFIDNNLSIESLAEKLDTNRRYLSQLINEEFSVNFNSYINEFRVKKAKELLLDKNFDYLNLEGIGTEVGFNSRVSFRNNFV